MSRTNDGARQRAGGPKRVLNLYSTCLKIGKRNTELKDLDVDSLVTEHIQVN